MTARLLKKIMWSTIAASEVTSQGFSPQEIASLQTIQNSSTVLAGILTNVVNEVRGNILAGGNQVDAVGTVPDQLRNQVLDIARWRWLINFPQLKALQTENREKAFSRAMETLEKIATEKLKTELPATPSGAAGPAGQFQQVSGECRQATRKKLKAL